jgi:hypothetical protein
VKPDAMSTRPTMRPCESESRGLVKPLIALLATMPPYECAMRTTSRPWVVSRAMAVRAESRSFLNVAFGFPLVDGCYTALLGLS